MADRCTPTPIVGQPEARCIPNPDAPEVDWTTKDELNPFLSRRNCQYSIVVDKSYENYNDLSRPALQYTSLGDNPEERIRGYLAYGVDKLLEYYFKNNEIPSTQREVLLTSALITYTESEELRYSISERPGSFVKVLVAIPYELFFNLPDRTYTPRYDEPRAIAARFDVRLLKAKVDFVASVIADSYGDKYALRGQLGPIPMRPLPGAPKLNLKSEARKMKVFLDNLQRLLDDNKININLSDIVTSREEYLDIIMDPDNYELLDVIYVSPNNEMKYLRAGWVNISSSSSSTTMALIYWTKTELFVRFNNNNNPTWNDFVDQYIYPPHDTSIYRIDLFGVSAIQNLLNETQVALINRNRENELLAEYLSGDRSVLPLLQQAVKTETELFRENNIIFDAAFQESLAQQTANRTRNTDLGYVLEERITNNLENLYDEILSSYDLRYLVAQAARCTGLEIIEPDILGVLRNLIEFLKRLPDLFQVTFDFSFDLYDILLDITGELVTWLFDLLVGFVNAVIREVVLGILEAIEKLCDEDFNYGTIDLSGLVSESFSPEEAEQFYRSISSDFGAGESAGDSIKELMRDVSIVLSVKEMCTLLSGSASREVLLVVHTIILRQKYEMFHDRFQSLEDVASFFTSFGSLLNPGICEIGFLVPGQLCEDGYNETLRRQLLAEAEGINTENVDELIAAERRRRQQILNQANEIINSESNALVDKFRELYDESVVSQQISSHPATRGSLSQAIQSMFVSTIVTMVNEGMGSLPTPFNIIETGFTPPGIEILARSQEQFPNNTGIMDVISSLEGYAFYSYGNTNGNISRRTTLRNANTNGIESADGGAELLSRINLNFDTNPSGRGGSGDTYYRAGATPNIWSYNTALYRRLGGYSLTGGPLFTVSYDNSAAAPEWWATEFGDANKVDNPQILTAFIKRNPIVGFPVGDRDGRDEVEGPILRGGGPLAALYPVDPLIIEAASDEFVESSRQVRINVFNDLPRVVEEGIVPNLGDFVSSPVSSEYTVKEIYANHIAQEIVRVAPELEVEYTDPVKVAAIAETHQNVMNDVARTLYKLTADSHFHYNPKRMVPALREEFKDTNQVNLLMGLNAIQDNVENALADSLVSSTSMGDVTKQVMGETALRFMIRIHIVEIFLKNIYSFLTYPEISGFFGNAILKVEGATERVAKLNVEAAFRGNRHEFFNRVLDVTDIADPILVSYIYEFIEYSTRVAGGCTTYRDLAVELATRERQQSGEEFISIKPNDENADTLAYFPSRVGATSYEAALKYYIAKESKEFLRNLQEFFDIMTSEMVVEEPSDKRSIMGSFLDKLQVLGYNVTRHESAPGDDSRNWISYGEGLYMDFYIRTGAMVHYFNDPVSIAHRDIRDEEYVGLRMNIRDSYYHNNETDSKPNNLNLLLMNLYTYAESTPLLSVKRSYDVDTGIPILNVEMRWSEVKRRLSITNNRPYENPRLQRRILDEMKRQLMELPEFKVMFEYVFPVKKIYNYLMIMMDQNSSAFLTNTNIRGLKLEGQERQSILNASCIDPEQFRTAKIASKSILENLYNSNNYRYINSDIEEVGGIANLALRNSLDDF